MVNEIKIPHEIVNDDVVTIAEWNFDNGAEVSPRDIVAYIETSKAVIEVEAEGAGYLEIVYPEGAEVGVGTVIGVVNDRQLKPQESGATKGAAVEEQASDAPLVSTNAGTAFSRKARLLMEAHGIDAGVFADRAWVREKEVLDYLQVLKLRETAGLMDSKPDGSDAADISVEVSKDAETSGVGLLRDAHLAAGDRNRSLLWLAFNYIWRTWLLSNLVRWAPRFAILRLHRWRGVKIGKGCFIDPAAIIETAHPGNITIGNDVRIAAQAIIMTHIKPPYLLRNQGIMTSTVQPVRLEDSCFIGVGAIIMPGVIVGKAAVVASGAVVLGDVPPYSMVAGNPARIVKHFSPAQ